MGEVEPRSVESDRGTGTIEQVVLENSALRMTVLPALGGKIASIQILPEGEELLQKPLQTYVLRTRYMSFDASDASGWDECLPSVAACEVQTASGVAQIPDHGDFWQILWETGRQSGNALTIFGDGFSLPLRFSKTLRLDGNRIRVSYCLRNLGGESVEYIWSAHPLFAVEPGDRIFLPDSIRDVTVEGSARNRLGERGTIHAWPKATLMNRDLVDLTLVGKVTDGVGDKLFAAAPPEGWCAIERKRLKRRIELRFDPQELPYLGLWICYGGWPDHGANRQQCVALEPCTARGDSLALAAEEGRARRLASRAEDRWSVELLVAGVS
jgi:galactose mutarotase-like enzyme